MSTRPSVWAGSARETLITASRDAWKKRLIDLSRRNNLLYYRPLVNGTLELPVSPDLAEFLASGTSQTLSELSGGKELSGANVRTIVRKGLENLEEKGLSTLFLALGRSSWTAEDGGRDAFAPILLFPITLKLKGHDIDATEIEIAGAPDVNPVLLHVLREELNVKVEAEEVLDAFRPEANALDGGGSEESRVDLQAILTLIAERARRVPGFTVQPFAVVGNFSFQKLAMVKNLEDRLDDLVAKRACSCFGLGRYLYRFEETWVHLNGRGEPVAIPILPEWALPPGVTMAPANGQAVDVRGPVDHKLTADIEGFRNTLGEPIYAEILRRAGHTSDSRTIPNADRQKNVVEWMQAATRGFERLHVLVDMAGDATFIAVMDNLKIASITSLPSLAALKQLVEELEAITGQQVA